MDFPLAMESIEENIMNNDHISQPLKDDLLKKKELAPYAFVAKVYYNDGNNQGEFREIQEAYQHLDDNDIIRLHQCEDVIEVFTHRLAALKSLTQNSANNSH